MHIFKKVKKETLTPAQEKAKLLDYLEQLKVLETKLWGVTIKHLADGEEQVLEDVNHLIYLFSHGKKTELKKILDSKNVKEFLDDLRNLKSDFLVLKKEVMKKEKLKMMVGNFTIKLVDHKNFSKLEEIFLLEKQLYDVIDKQEEELNALIGHVSAIKVDITERKSDVFLGSLNKLRRILAGHMDHHALWDEERQGYSNTSNIIHSLQKSVRESF